MDKERQAIERLKIASEMSLRIYEKPLIVTTSGGKDSSVLVELAIRAEIPFEVKHSHTTADAPDTVHFVKREFKRLEERGVKPEIVYPMYKGKRACMWNIIPMKGMPPDRFRRYCCEILKEGNNNGRFVATGVRWAESVKRRDRAVYETYNRDKNKKIILNSDNDEKRELFETCQLKAKRICNPVIDWTDTEIWNYINAEKIPVNPLYFDGWTRVGCVGCPLASKKIKAFEFARFPKFKNLYIRAFDRMLEERKRKNLNTNAWKTGIDVFHWWVEDGVLPGQMEMELEGLE